MEKKWLVAIAVALGALLEIIDTSIVNVALTEMQASLGATLTQMSWVVSSYAIANVIILPLSAWLGNRFGKRRYFVFSLVGFTAASVLCGVATSLWMLTAARVLQGLCGGGLLAKAQAFLFETFPKEEQAQAQGFFGAIVIAGPVIGPTLGGYIVTNVGWRWIFFINLPVGVVATMMCVAFLPRDTPSASRSPVDWIAIALLALGLGSLQVFLEEGYSEDWFQSEFIVVTAFLAVAGLVLFVLRVLASPHPVVDLRVLRYRSLAAGSVLSVIVGMALYGALFAIPIFSSSVLHYTAQEVGLLLLPGALASAFTMPVASILVRKLEPRVMLAIGAVILGVAVLWLGRLSVNTSADDLFWPLLVRSFGTVMMFIPLSMTSLGSIPKKDIAASTALYNLTRQLGGSVGVALLSTLLGSRTTFHRAILVEHLSPTDPAVQARLDALTAGFVAKGMDVASAKQTALAMLDGSARLQSSVLAFNDIFFVTALLVLFSIPLIFVLGKPSQGAAVADAH
ncbi:MAG: DHA2 family efflux MFS transporter permease subunit [Labilithrix sp.]|nr:DHA2 family efflux MFS transporter permease subunit [Labilithrix sp.]MCW5816172.1 DHA2 family efflux MFS transporter permease subunit [Labilithrix sp.]